MFFKLGALLYATSAQIEAGELYNAATPAPAARTAQKQNDEEKNASASGQTRDLGEEKKQKDDDLSEDSIDYMMDEHSKVTMTPRSDHSLDVPYPPFTPGIAGLVSPHSRKVNQGQN